MMSEAKPLGRLLRQAAKLLRHCGRDSPALTAQLIAGKILGLSRTEIILRSEMLLNAGQIHEFQKLVAQRAAGHPLAHLLGEKEFFGLEFKLTENVLIPRPETEHLLEEALQIIPADKPFYFADMGTGSGVLAVCLAFYRKQAFGLAVDREKEALKVASENASFHGVADRILFIRADFANPPVKDGAIDLVLSNPPYISEEEFLNLSPEVRLFEPKAALVPAQTESPVNNVAGRGDGLASLAAILPQARRILTAQGLFFAEIGSGQGQRARTLALRHGFKEARIITDLAGHERILSARISDC